MEKNVFIEIRTVDATGVLNEPVICDRDKANAYAVYICSSEDRINVRRQWIMHDKLYCVAESVAARISKALGVNININPAAFENYSAHLKIEPDPRCTI